MPSLIHTNPDINTNLSSKLRLQGGKMDWKDEYKRDHFWKLSQPINPIHHDSPVNYSVSGPFKTGSFMYLFTSEIVDCDTLDTSIIF